MYTRRTVAALITLLIFGSLSYLSAQSTTFTYQGRLKSGALAASGSYDFEFRLFDAAAGGAQVGGVVTALNVPVTEGTFSIDLDFGDQFPGAPRFLAIGVRQSGVGAFTPLDPRQPISSTPYAIRSLNAGTSTNATQLDGLPSTRYVQQDIAGNVSIGGNLTVNGSASYNVVNAATEYDLGGQRILRSDANNNLFTGFGTGTITTGFDNSFFGTGTGNANQTGNENSFFGKSAGLRNTTGSSNSFFGINAGINNTTGDNNTFIGSAAGTANATGGYNTFVGRFSGLKNTVSGNSFFGAFSGQENTVGQFNSFFGNSAGLSNTTGSSNSIFGYQAGINNTTGNESVLVGSSAGFSNSTGPANVFIGSGAGYLNSTGGFNTFVGRTAGQFNTASFNAFFGAGAGEQNTTGTDNTFVGTSVGAANTTGTSNSFFGRNAGLNNTTASDNSFFGSGSGSANTTGYENSFFGKSSGLRNTAGYQNSFFGVNAGINNTTGFNNTFLGAAAGTGNSNGIFNVYVGRFAGLAATSGSSNVFVGASAGENNTTGFYNTFVGTSAGGGTCPQAPCPGTLTGNSNAYFGAGSGQATTTGSLNAFFGYNTGTANTTGSFNSFVGNNAGIANTTGTANNFIGGSSGGNNTTGAGNAFFGDRAGYDDAGNGSTTGNANTFVGNLSGRSIVSGSDNTMLGAGTAGTSAISSATAIGARASVTQDNSIVLGAINGVNGAVADTNVGIGTTAPTTRFQVRTATGNYGVTHTDGTISVGSYVGSSSSGATGGWLGTISNHKLFFYTNGGQPSMTVDTTGNVGVGSTAPGSKLTVAGVVESTSGGIKFPDGTTQTTASGAVPANLVNTVNGLTGNVTIAQGTGITVNTAGNTVTIASTGVDASQVILNQTTQQAAANFNVAGTGKANILDVTTQYNIGGTRAFSSFGFGSLWIGKGAGSVIPSPGNADDFNTYVGAAAGGASDGQSNSFFGASAGGTNHFGSQNTFVGYLSGFSNTDGNNNTFVGANSNANTTGSNNTFLGLGAGVSNSIGSNNTILGTGANVGTNNLNFATAVGASAQVTTSNTIVLGRNADTVQVPGNMVVSGTFTNPSDARLKQNIRGLQYGLDAVLRLRPVTWQWKTQPNGKALFGMIAQDVDRVMPELVEHPADPAQPLTMNYLGFVPVIVKAMQEQQAEIAKQKELLDAQQKQIEALKQIVCLQNPKTDICKKN